MAREGIEKNIGRIWISLTVLAIAIIIWTEGDSLGAIKTNQGEAPFLVALTQLGILYIIALFVERALEVLIKAWWQGGRILLEEGMRLEIDDQAKAEKETNLERYKADTQRRVLLVGFTLEILMSLAGVGLLGPIFHVSGGGAIGFQAAVFQFADIVITAGLIAGGSSTIHEDMALIAEFLKSESKESNGRITQKLDDCASWRLGGRADRTASWFGPAAALGVWRYGGRRQW